MSGPLHIPQPSDSIERAQVLSCCTGTKVLAVRVQMYLLAGIKLRILTPEEHTVAQWFCRLRTPWA
jgi:hypothetical protein